MVWREKGLARFDGYLWHAFRSDDCSGLPSSFIYEMAVDAYGVLWVATEEGLVSFDHGTQKFNRLKLNNPSYQKMVDATITSLVVDPFNNLVVGTPKGFFW